MGTFDALLKQIASPTEVKLAGILADEDQHLLARLVEIRKERGLSQDALADLLGVTQAAISSFERAGNDPRLSTIRRYARALGVLVLHKVEESPDLACNSREIWHLTDDSIHATATAQSAFRQSRQATAWPPEATAPASERRKVPARA